ncbi:MAG: UDP-3-O-(3-hydroxymyristoyl)glucosamine N-acyltransferase [Fulvivirga sp.]|uniref:UDP-3-O-(3-hydroxymyristoyl)glucosamine N-acyltransferase n=1 Tax=Fulvivirga sp. TaxID=1931237 RepID=UPI0032ECC286
MEFTVSQIAELLGGKVEGNGDDKIKMLGKIQEAKAGEISFLSNPKYEPHIYDTKATAVIVSKGFSPKKKLNTSLILVDDPYSSFTVLLEEYHKFITFQKSGVEDPSFIGENSKVGIDVYRGAFSYIGSNVKIGDNVKIYPHAYVGDNVEIGDNTIINAGVKLYANTKIGHHCVIHSGCVIGSDGFGFAPQADGSYKTIPQMGNVVIGNYVDIGSNTVIDCATFHGDSTKLEDGVKLDNLVQLAHNVKVGKHTVIAAQTGVSGSTTIGKYCVIAGQVGIIGHVNIADKTSIGAQAGVSKDTASGSKLWGTPAIDVMKYQRSYAVYKNLPDLNFRLKQLEEKVLNLPTFRESE